MMVGKPPKHATARAPKSRLMPASPAREPAATIIAKRIEEDIVLGRRQPRERLIEQDLCDLFQTHRGDVRLALFELEKMGLVERIPNRGALVRGLTPLEVREIYAVREELEVMAVRIIPFPVGIRDIETLEELQREHSAAIAAGDLLTVFYSNLRFHQVLFGLCGNACLIETIDLLAQKVYGIRSYANAFPESLDRARQDHLDMITALRGSRRDDLIVLSRGHLKPSPEAYIKDYERRFGKADLAPAH
jgi:DNA-binding GntR family transcriptional regulator